MTLDGASKYSFANTGIYDVRLNVTGPGGSNTKTEWKYITVGVPTIEVSVGQSAIVFGTMSTSAPSTGNTQITVTTSGGGGWSITAAANNGGYMKSGATPLAKPFELANGAGSFHDMSTNFADFMTGNPDEDKTNTANVRQTIDAADQPGDYAITVTFTGAFS